MLLFNVVLGRFVHITSARCLYIDIVSQQVQEILGTKIAPEVQHLAIKKNMEIYVNIYQNASQLLKKS